MNDQYEVQYGQDGNAQINRVPQQSQRAMPQDQGGYYQQPPYGYPPYKEPFRLPAVVNTILSIGFAAALFFGMEKYAPHDLKPSTTVGAYEASIDQQLKAAELNEQARFAQYEAEVKVAVETQAKQNEMMLQGILQQYQATYDLAKIYAQTTGNLQGQMVAARISQIGQTQSTDTGLISISKLYGRVANVIEPGAGDAALAYSESLTTGIVDSLTQAAQDAARVDMVDWNIGIASPDQVQAMVASVRPVQIPKPPSLSRHGYSDQAQQEDRASQHGGR